MEMANEPGIPVQPPASEIRRTALKLLAASQDAEREQRFDAGSRGRKASIAEGGASLLCPGDPALAAQLSSLASKLRRTDCWGARPRLGLAAVFRQAALSLHPAAPADLRNLTALAMRRRDELAEEMMDVLLGRGIPKEPGGQGKAGVG